MLWQSGRCGKSVQQSTPKRGGLLLSVFLYIVATLLFLVPELVYPISPHFWKGVVLEN